MNQNLIYYPCFALLVLSTFVLVRMFIARVQALRKGLVDVKHFKTYDYHGKNHPVLMTQASRNFSNLFEVPTLFYMVCLFALVTQKVDGTFLGLAWLYVLFRYLHSAVHLTTNKIVPRMSTYGLSWLVLIIMGVLLALRIASIL